MLPGALSEFSPIFFEGDNSFRLLVRYQHLFGKAMQNTTKEKEVNGAATQWLTSAEAAQYLKIGRRTLLHWVRQGKVRAYILSGTKRHVWRFKTSDLDAMQSVPACALE